MATAREATPPAARAPRRGRARIGAGQAPADAPRRAGEGVVRDRREALLVLAQRQQQVGYPVGRRQLAVRGPHAEAVHPPAAGRDEQRAALADQPDAERAALEREAGVALELALVVAEQVAEQALRDRLARAASRAPLRPHHASRRGTRTARG